MFFPTTITTAHYDLIRDDPSAKPAAEQRIAEVPLPERDPLYGINGPMWHHWMP